MKVGAASVDITPHLGMALEGYGARISGASGIHDPLCAQALVAEGADGTGVALVEADLCWVGPRLQDLIAKEVRERTGIPRHRLQLAATHNHSGPAFPEPSDVERSIAHSIADCMARAWAVRREAGIAVGIGRVDGIGANRRPTGGPVDDRVTVARFEDADGRPIATLVNYGCHPTTLGPNNTLYTADFPGVLRREVDAAIGGVTIFSTGPEGDINPGGYSPEESMVGVVAPWRTFESAERYGQILASCVLDVYRGLEPAPTDRVWGDSQIVDLQRKQLPDAAVARAAAAMARASERALREADLTADATYHALLAATYADLIAAQAADPERERPVRVRVSALAFGPFLHVGVQGEPFMALGQQIRTGLGDETTCVAALCDGTVGYIPTVDAFAVGGYEPNASYVRAGEGERLVEAVVALAASARSTVNR
jgi:hypothetical protein